MTDTVQILRSVTVQDIKTLLFFFLGESILMYYVAIKLFDITFTWGKLISVAAVYSLLVMLIRKIYIYYKIPFGSHTLYLALIFFILTLLFFKPNIFKSLGGTLVTYSLLMLGAPVAFKVVDVLKLSNDQIFASFLLSTAIGYTEATYLFIAALIFAITNFNIYKILKM